MPVTTTDHIRARLAFLCDRDRRSIAAIARQAGLARVHLDQVLSGARPNPSIATVAKILDATASKWADLD